MWLAHRRRRLLLSFGQWKNSKRQDRSNRSKVRRAMPARSLPRSRRCRATRTLCQGIRGARARRKENARNWLPCTPHWRYPGTLWSTRCQSSARVLKPSKACGPPWLRTLDRSTKGPGRKKEASRRHCGRPHKKMEVWQKQPWWRAKGDWKNKTHKKGRCGSVKKRKSRM